VCAVTLKSVGLSPQIDDSFRLLVEGVRDYAIFLLDPTGRILSWNLGAQRLKQYAPEEIIGKHMSVFYPPEDLAWDKPAFELRETLREGRFEDEGWRLRKDGTRFWANVVLTALRDQTGELRGFAKITRDLTTRKAAEEELRQSEMRSRLLIESIRDYAVFMLDTGGRVATWNPGAERIKGYKAEEIIGKSFTTFYSDEDIRSGKCELELSQAAAVGRFEDEGWRIRKDGTRFWANVVISAVRDEEGQLLGFSKVTRDLTDRRKAEDERAARLAAEQANRSKDEFLAMLGHELRNPLAPIVTALQLMKLKNIAPASREQVIIERQVKHMVRLVDDLLDVSRITRGKIELKKERIDLRDVVAKAVEAVSPLMEQRKHHFEVQVPQAPVFVDGDEARLTQVLVNLLTNAAKYTEPGGHVALEVRRRDDQVEVQVRDDGTGIAAELLPNVFELFVQGGQGVDRPAGGLGIGLAVVRSLTALHGGTVEAQSAGKGAGSTFTVRLPAAVGHVTTENAAAASAPAQGPSSGRRVVVVDDNLDAVELVGEALRSMGDEVRTAMDGSSALKLIKEWKPDVAILDIGLPVMDGNELAVRIRAEMGATAPQLIALTGYGQKRDRDRTAQAGFRTHLVKPIDLQLLADAIAEASPARERPAG
jgi:PAS domain S-box-containing protein